MRLYDPSGDLAWAWENQTDGYGSYSKQLTIPATWPIGDYTLKVDEPISDSLVELTFTVTEAPTGPPPSPPVIIPTPPTVDEVEALPPEDAADQLEEADPGAAADVIEGLETDTAVDVFEEMDAEAAADIFDQVDVETASEIIVEMNTSSAAAIIDEVEVEVAVAIFEEVAVDEAADILEEVESEAAAEVFNVMNITVAAEIIVEVAVEAAAEVFNEMNATVAAEIVEDVAVDDAADIVELMNSSAAAGVIEEVEVAAAADIVVEMEDDSAAEMLAEANVTSAVEIVEVVVEADEEDAGELLDAAVSTNSTEAFAEILNEMDENATAGALLASEPASGGALVEDMAKKDVNKAAERVEAAVKLRARELDPEAEAALLQQAADMLEEVSVESLVDLFITIANLPATPSTVADVFSVMDVEKVLQVIDAWVTAGYGNELGLVFNFLPSDVLSNLWTGMTVEDRSTLYMYLSDEVVTELPAVVTQYPQVVVHLKGSLATDSQLNALISDLNYVEWHVIFNGLTEADLGDASMLILVQGDSSIDYTDEELIAIKTWYEEGGKTIWVASDSDYGNDALRQPTANSVLEYLGSAMRFEHSSVEDPVSNGFAPYRVLAISENVDPEYEFLVSGVERGLFHGPGIVVGYENGEYVKLEENSIENVHVIMTTSEYGVVVDNSEPFPEAHQAGDEGTFPVMVIEVDYDLSGVIIATGDAPFGQYMGLYKPEMLRADRYGDAANPQQGGRLFANIIDYAVQYSGVLFNYANTVEASDNDIIQLGAEISGLEGDRDDLEAEVEILEDQASDIQDEIIGLEDEVATLYGDISGLGDEVADIEVDIAAKNKSISNWQIYTAVFLIVGLIVGYFVETMMNKPKNS